MPSRRRARELAFQMLYQWEIGQHTPAHIVATFLTVQRTEAEEESFARTLFEGAVEKREELDHQLREFTQHWRLERMAAVDRNILRLAITELAHFAQTPHKVVIDEAVEIAKAYSTEESSRFVNGVIDAAYKQLCQDKADT